MSGKIRLLVTLSIFAALLIILNLFPQNANASPNMVTAPEQYLTLPSSSFIADESTSYIRGYSYILSTQTDGVFYAPIVLQNGVTLQTIIIFYVDNSTTGTVKAQMRSTKLATGDQGYLGGVESDLAGISTEVEKMRLFPNKTINKYNAYTLHITMDANCYIYGIRLIYTLP